MILSFINIRKVPREMLKTSGFDLGFQHLPRDLANVYERKIMFDPYNIFNSHYKELFKKLYSFSTFFDKKIKFLPQKFLFWYLDWTENCFTGS